MSIQSIKTIQSGLETSYSDSYIKQALSNLGQRNAATKDSIINKTLSIKDIANTGFNSDVIKEYVCAIYNGTTIKYVYDSDVDGAKTFSTYSENEIVNVQSISIIETIEDWNKFNAVKIIKNHNTSYDGETGSYFVLGICANNATNKHVLALEFTENNHHIIKGIKITAGSTSTTVVQFKDDTVLANGDGKKISKVYNAATSIDNIYNAIANYTNIDDIVNALASSMGMQSTEVELTTDEFNAHKINLQYYSNVLPVYIKNEYNKGIYYGDGSYIGLKKSIIANFIKQLYRDSGILNVSNQNLFRVYFPKDFQFIYIANNNTEAVYNSYDISVAFRNNIDGNNFDSNTITAQCNSDERVAGYNFYVTYLDNEEYVDTIEVNLAYILPYIKTNTDNTSVWVIDGKITDIPTTGANAGNPNIMMIAYNGIESSDSVAYTEGISVIPYLLHTYEEGQLRSLIESSLTNPSNQPVEFTYVTSSSIGTENQYKFSIKLPELSTILNEEYGRYEKIVKNCLLMTFVDTKINVVPNETTGNTLQQELHGSGSASSFITVYWNIKQDNGVYSWQPIINPLYATYNTETGQYNYSNCPVLDLGSMFSFKEFISYYANTLYAPDKYEHSWIVFDPVQLTLKNTPATSKQEARIYPIFKTDPGKNYLVESGNYTNNLNYVPKFIAEHASDNSGNVRSYVVKSVDDIGITDVIDDNTYTNKFFSFKSIDGANAFKETIKLDNGPDYIPNNATNSNTSLNYYPTFDFKEVFTSNQTALNRLSLLTVAGSGVLYHSIFGFESSFGQKTLTIGSIAENYNLMQNSTLVERSACKFATTERVAINIPLETTHEIISRGLTLTHVGNNKYTCTITVPADNVAITADSTNAINIERTPYGFEAKTITPKYFKAKDFIVSFVNSNSNNGLNITIDTTDFELDNINLGVNTDKSGSQRTTGTYSFVYVFERIISSGGAIVSNLDMPKFKPVGCSLLVNSDDIAIY